MRFNFNFDNETYLAMLGRWASVSRTLHESERLLEGFLSSDPKDKPEAWEVINNVEELTSLEPAINALHQTVRMEIWKEEVRRGSKFGPLRPDPKRERTNMRREERERTDRIERLAWDIAKMPEQEPPMTLEQACALVRARYSDLDDVDTAETAYALYMAHGLIKPSR